VQLAIANAGQIDERKVDAQQARRILDRLVGYKASPVLWKTVKKGISAGRVQTVALRLLVEREREIRAFKPVEYWTVEALLEKDKQQFTAKLHLLDGKKPVINNESEASGILSALTSRKTFQVTEVKRRERRKNPAAPFTTSTLQQDAAKKLSFGSKRTMRLAQDLYEGIEIGEEGAVGLITYMRTDSTRVALSAAEQARDYIKMMYGQQYLPDAPRLYTDGKVKNAQDAHESIRPTDPTRRPDHIRKYPEGRSVSPVRIDLAALHGVPDVASRVRYDHGGFRPWPLPVQGHRQRRQVRRVPEAVQGIARSRGRESARGRTGTSRGREGREHPGPCDHAIAALHRAAAARFPRRALSKSWSGWASVVRPRTPRSSRRSSTAAMRSWSSVAFSPRSSASKSRE